MQDAEEREIKKVGRYILSLSQAHTTGTLGMAVVLFRGGIICCGDRSVHTGAVCG